MIKSERAARSRRALDRRFSSLDIDGLRTQPKLGWVGAIRRGLGMSQAELARWLDVTPPAVAGLERSEREETISIGRLAELARALDCTLVCALVPNTTLEDTVQREARQRATESLGYVGRTMDLESQGLDLMVSDELLTRESQRVIHEHRVWRRR